MSRHYDRKIREAQEVAASVGRKPERTEPRTRAEIESFIKGFGVSAASVKRIADEWEADRYRYANQQIWEQEYQHGY